MASEVEGVLDESKVKRAGGHSYTGAVVELLRLEGARVSRVMHPPGQRIEPHEHDWPVLALYRLGAYRESADCGRDIAFDGPSFVFHPAGATHADEIGDSGLETLAMTFDPTWLTPGARAALPTRSKWRSGGAASAAARQLAELWLAPRRTEADVHAATSHFLLSAFREPAARTPAWADDVMATLACERTETARIAEDLTLHPAWLARAYRAWRGEGMTETLRRRRVERAMNALRFGAASLAAIAAECGFADQSHMNRCFRAVLGRSPLDVRREAQLLAPIAAHA